MRQGGLGVWLPVICKCPHIGEGRGAQIRRARRPAADADGNFPIPTLGSTKASFFLLFAPSPSAFGPEDRDPEVLEVPPDAGSADLTRGRGTDQTKNTTITCNSLDQKIPVMRDRRDVSRIL